MQERVHPVLHFSFAMLMASLVLYLWYLMSCEQLAPSSTSRNEDRGTA